MCSLAAAVVAPFLLMASQLSGLPIPHGAAPPTVDLVETTEFDHGGRLGWKQGQSVGVTNLQTGAISLYAGWHLGNNDTCVLVHELVHYLQVVNDVDITQTPEIEAQAWGVTVQCYKSRGEVAQAYWARRQKEWYLGGKYD